MIRCAWDAILGPAAPNYALFTEDGADNTTEGIADAGYLAEFILGGWRSSQTPTG